MIQEEATVYKENIFCLFEFLETALRLLLFASYVCWLFEHEFNAIGAEITTGAVKMKNQVVIKMIPSDLMCSICFGDSCVKAEAITDQLAHLIGSMFISAHLLSFSNTICFEK